MSQFYGTVNGGQKTEATRRGFKPNGLTTHAAGWSGAIRVDVFWNETEQRDEFEVTLTPWKNSAGQSSVIARGVLDASIHNETIETFARMESLA
jgi:hypothetical protein